MRWGLRAKRCCDMGCNTEKIGEEGYRVTLGFMLWACPKHEEKWKTFDLAQRQYYQAQGGAFEKDLIEWETAWYEKYERENPSPTTPRIQPSEIT